MHTNRVHRLRHRPDGALQPGDLELVEEPVPEPADDWFGEAIEALGLDERSTSPVAARTDEAASA